MALGLAIAGILAVFSGGLLLITAGTAVSTPTSADEPCVPSTAWTETTDWLTTPPAGEGWTVVDQRTVTDKEAYDEQVLVTPEVPAVSEIWANFAPKDQQATFIGPPVWDQDPRGEWIVHQQVPGGHEGADGVYARGDPSKGGNWFYRRAARAAVPAVYETVHHAAVTHQELRYARQHAAVVCEPTSPTTQPTTQPPEVEPTTATATPSAGEEPAANPESDSPESEVPEVLGEQASAPPAPQVPTVVDAGYAGQPSGEDWGAALVVGGLLLLTSSGAVAVTRRT